MTQRSLADVRGERVRAGAQCLNLQRVAERMQKRAAALLSERQDVVTMPADEYGAIARDVGEAAEAAHDLHDRLTAEELSYCSELPIGG